MPDERDGRSGRHVEVDAVQHLGTVAVTETNVLEADVAFDLWELLGAGAVDDLRLLVHHVHDLVESGDGGQEGVVEL